MTTTDPHLSYAELMPATLANIQRGAKALLQGQLVAFPTETVFGLGAAVTELPAIHEIFKAKGRPSEHPLIAHIAPGADLTGWVDRVTPTMQKLIDAFWPGPLTLVVPKGERMPLEVTGGQNSVGIRCPSHPVAMSLLKAVGVPVAAPSANRFGRVSPTRAAHVVAELGNRIPYILDGEVPEVGIESTIVSLLNDQPAILRPGAITAAQIEAVLGVQVKTHSEVSKTPNANPRVSGALEKHYSPDAKVLILSASDLIHWSVNQKTLCVGWSDEFLTQANTLRELNADVQIEALNNNAAEVAKALYATLRQADELACKQILFEKPASHTDWEAVSDRLKRAAA
ncbi:L-threonylcarbamoyladenylate synthase [Limnobacter parvus]|uniref:Threonylcarbamoyl-AMP synthase n=1 Tax=Limnobacter parvus TaxID=2939690 RepID=A0ABT1XGD3_9BURK|nr:L-threonylcarbamoyladenylate synthase [Limnobacter parvus]MCR2746350.1 L-threonylcarbamoyladenylate synthase [Limnobacter parvus]